MSRITDAILACAVAEVESRTEWDEPPELYLLFLHGGEPKLAPVGLSPVMWSWGRPADALEAIAYLVPEFAARMRGTAGGLHGAGFRCEAWGIETAPDADPATRLRDHQTALAHRIKDRPDRIEIRTLVVVDRAGLTYAVEKHRDSGEVIALAMSRRSDIGATGQVPDALDRLVTGLLSVPLAQRPDVPDAFWSNHTPTTTTPREEGQPWPE